MKLDKKEYAAGETATALVASPYAHADVYFAVIRNDAIYRTMLRDVSGSARIAFKVTPEMLPNAAVEAVVVHRGASRGSDARLAVVGMAGFTVDLAERYLKLAILPRSATVLPGGKQHVAFALADSRGAPVRGEIVAMAVNDAILQLSGYRLPDLVQTVFAQQPIATIFADNRENVTLKTPTPPLEKGYGYGGGFLAGAASTRVRANFRPLAYYGVLRTDAGGRASADFAMPDDLTTWRVMAVALDYLALRHRRRDVRFNAAAHRQRPAAAVRAPRRPVRPGHFGRESNRRRRRARSGARAARCAWLCRRRRFDAACQRKRRKRNAGVPISRRCRDARGDLGPSANELGQ